MSFILQQAQTDHTACLTWLSQVLLSLYKVPFHANPSASDQTSNRHREQYIYTYCLKWHYFPIIHWDLRGCGLLTRGTAKLSYHLVSFGYALESNINLVSTQYRLLWVYMWCVIHVTRIKSEIIQAQKARKTLGKLNWAIQFSSFLYYFFLTMK